MWPPPEPNGPFDHVAHDHDHDQIYPDENVLSRNALETPFYTPWKNEAFTPDAIIRGAARRIEAQSYPTSDAAAQHVAPDLFIAVRPHVERQRSAQPSSGSHAPQANISTEYHLAQAPAPEHQSPFARRAITLECYKGLFKPAEEIVFEALAAHQGKLVTLSTLSTLTKTVPRSVQFTINQINKVLIAERARPILSLEATFHSETEYILEAARPIAILASPHFELRRHSFCYKNTLGELHDIALRNEEFFVLEHLIARAPQGATKKELDKIIDDNSTEQNNDQLRLLHLVRSVNTRLKDTPIEIRNIAPRFAKAIYAFDIGSRHQDAAESSAV